MKPALLVVLASFACRAPESAAPAPAHAFDWTIGTWRGTRRDAEDGSEAPLAVRVRPVLGGAGQLEELEVEHARGTYRGLHLRLFDPDTGRWTTHYANATRGRLTTFECDRWTATRCTWLPLAPTPGRRSRVELERPHPDRWTRTNHVSHDEGATWTVLFVDALERVP